MGVRVLVYNQLRADALSFKGVDYFPYDPAYRVALTFRPDPKLPPRIFRTSRGTDKQFFHAGDGTFTLKGKTFTLPFYADGNDPKKIAELSAFFVDDLTGKGTYGAGRYVDIDSFGPFRRRRRPSTSTMPTIRIARALPSSPARSRRMRSRWPFKPASATRTPGTSGGCAGPGDGPNFAQRYSGAEMKKTILGGGLHRRGFPARGGRRAGARARRSGSRRILAHRHRRARRGHGRCGQDGPGRRHRDHARAPRQNRRCSPGRPEKRRRQHADHARQHHLPHVFADQADHRPWR